MAEKVVRLNGEEKSVVSTNLGELLVELSLAGKKIAVELNQAIIPKAAYDTTPITHGDRVEVVTFVGGG